MDDGVAVGLFTGRFGCYLESPGAVFVNGFNAQITFFKKECLYILFLDFQVYDICVDGALLNACFRLIQERDEHCKIAQMPRQAVRVKGYHVPGSGRSIQPSLSDHV